MLRKTLLLVLSAMLPLALAGLYANRKPTPAEEKTIANYAAVMNRVLDQFRSDDWDENVDYTIDQPMVAPLHDRPLDFDQLLQRTYDVHPGSHRYQTVVLPKLQKMAAENDLSKKQLQGALVQDLMHLQVQVHSNMLVVPMSSAPDPKVDPKVPGATFVHKDRDNPFGHGAAYVLFFSNGKPGRWEETNSVYRNTFVHPPATPYIENLEIRIYGADDRIQELLQKIDWKQVNAALTL